MEEKPESVERFLADFVQGIEGEDTFPFKTVPFSVSKEEVEGVCIDWVLQYLSQNQCPVPLSLRLARAVAAECQNSSLTELLDEDTGQGIEADSLAGHVHKTLVDVIRRWMMTSPSDGLNDVTLTCKSVTVSSHAVRNSRRKMEDRHTVIEDLNLLYGLKSDAAHSFYGVYDGHGGVDAAAYASAHVHTHLARNPGLNTDPAAAMVEALRQTDEAFSEKAKKEGLKSGTTGVCVLIREDHMYVAWLGDSQAVLVRSGEPITVMNPHKPEREDESRRIEGLGGCVVWFGAWRVNGSLSVSRAIGDCDHKPYVSGQADVSTVPLDGTEDYVILACDGLWDVLSGTDVTHLVYDHVTSPDGDQSNVAQTLVQAAKDRGSHDNITVIVVFLRETVTKPPPEPYEDEDEDDLEPWSQQDLQDTEDTGAGSPRIPGANETETNDVTDTQLIEECPAKSDTNSTSEQNENECCDGAELKGAVAI